MSEGIHNSVSSTVDQQIQAQLAELAEPISIKELWH